MLLFIFSSNDTLNVCSVGFILQMSYPKRYTLVHNIFSLICFLQPTTGHCLSTNQSQVYCPLQSHSCPPHINHLKFGDYDWVYINDLAEGVKCHSRFPIWWLWVWSERHRLASYENSGWIQWRGQDWHALLPMQLQSNGTGWYIEWYLIRLSDRIGGRGRKSVHVSLLLNLKWSVVLLDMNITLLFQKCDQLTQDQESQSQCVDEYTQDQTEYHMGLFHVLWWWFV